MGMTRFDVIVHTADDLVRATQLAASRSPKIAIVDLGDDDRGRLRRVCPELRAVCPQLSIAAAYRGEAIGEIMRPTDEEQSGLFVDGVRAGADDFLRRPVATDELRQLLDRVMRNDRDRSSDPGTVVAFLSNKGGVGKSTLAVNSAVGLAQKTGEDVLLIDASLQMGVCAALLDLLPSSTLADVARERDRLDATLLRQLATPHDSGVDLIAAPPSAIDAESIDEELIAQILTTGRRSYRHVVVDTFPILDGTVVSTLDAADLAFVVLDNVVPTVLGAAKLIELLDELGQPRPRRRVVLNRFTKVEGHVGVADVETTLGADVDFVLPFDKRLMTAANLGRPIAERRRRFSAFDREFAELIGEILAVRPGSGGGRLADLATQSPQAAAGLAHVEEAADDDWSH